VPELGEQVHHHRIDVARVTPRSAPPYATITYPERNSIHVLTSDDGTGKLLIGPLGVNYYEDGAPGRDVVYLRRWDMPQTRQRRRND